MSIEFFDYSPSLNDMMRDDRNDRMNSSWNSPLKDRWKEDKWEPFDFNRLTNDFSNGTIEAARFFPEINSSHGDHIDLGVRMPGQDEKKYRIHDINAANNLFNDIGPNWQNFGF